MSQSGETDPRHAAAEHRAEIVEEGPVVTDDRYLQDNNGTPECNLGAAGRDILGVVPGDEVTVDVYRDHVEIYPTDGE